MPSTLSSGLQATIRKCLQVDRRKRMTLRQVLKDDPWLTDNGRLSCPVSTSPKTVFEETMVMQDGDSREDRDNKTRKQFMKDLERDAQTTNKVRRTVIYHPLNTSTYYTTKAGSSQSMAAAGGAQQVQNVELLRSELLQSIRSRARRLGMKSAERWETLRSPGLKSLLFSSFQHKKKGSLFTPSSHTSSSTTTSSSRSLSEMVQRITKDQVYHFQLTNHHQHTQQSSRPPSLSSSTSTSSLSSSLDARDSAVATIEDEILSMEKKSSREVMALLKQTCQLMGITYVQDSSMSLHCVLTLRSAPKKADKTSSSSATLLSTSNSPAPPPISAHTRKQSQTSSTGTMMGGDETSSSTRKRLSLPLISHLTSSMTTSFFGRSKPRHSMDETATVNKSVSPEPNQRKQKEGTAMFTIQLESHKKKVDRVSLRFSKQQGSNTVFKMAGGWVAGVMALDGKIGR